MPSTFPTFMHTPKILFICGSLNQTTMLHSIARWLPDTRQYFTPFYSDGLLRLLTQAGMLNWTILGGEFRRATEEFLLDNHAVIDYEGRSHAYDLVVTCQDLIVPKNVRHKKLVLVQEGMTDPENLIYHMVKWLKLPRYLASTSTTGLSDLYDVFCVASPGYRDHFIRKGVRPEKLRVTGIPNFDNCIAYQKNSFPDRDYVLVATSDARETFKSENRRKFIEKAVSIADGRRMIFKLHPNEQHERAVQEIRRYAPQAHIYIKGNAHEMVANCSVLVTRYSTLAYTGIALGKEVHSEFDLTELHRLTPIQNGGRSAKNTADVCRAMVSTTVSGDLGQTPIHRTPPARNAQRFRKAVRAAFSTPSHQESRA